MPSTLAKADDIQNGLIDRTAHRCNAHNQEIYAVCKDGETLHQKNGALHRSS
jgi:hypothetical protein